MGELVQALNSVTPLGLAAGMGYIIYLQVKNKGRVKAIETNHLHGLPEMAATLERIEAALKGINDNVIHIRARVNGK